MFQGLYFVNITLCTNLCVSSLLINEGHCFGEDLTETHESFPRTSHILSDFDHNLLILQSSV